MITSIDVTEAFDKMQKPFMIKTLSKLGIETNFLNLIKTVSKKHIVNIIFSSEKLKALPLRSSSRQGCPLSPLFSI